MMVENTLSTTEGPSTVVEHEKTLEKSKPGKQKTRSNYKAKDATEWSNDTEDDIVSDEEWEDGQPRHDTCDTWNPQEFDKKTNNVGSWKEMSGPQRVQDLPSPAIASAPPEHRLKQGVGDDIPPAGPSRKDSCEFNDEIVQALEANQNIDHDEDVFEEDDRAQAWKMRETWKSSSHSKSSGSESTERLSGSRKGRKSGVKGSDTKRSSRKKAVENDVGEDAIPSVSKSCSSSSGDDRDIVEHDDTRPEKLERKASSSRSADRDGAGASEDEDDENLGVGSFHGLRKDADKKTTRSNSHGRKTPTGARTSRAARNKTPMGGRPSRRKMKDKDLDFENDVDIEKAKPKGDASRTPGSRSSRERRKARQRAYSEEDSVDDDAELTTIEAPRSTGKRHPTARRNQVRRESSERFRRATDDDYDTSEAIKIRAQETLIRANRELSQSAHGTRRYHGGSSGLDARSYHGTEYSRRGHHDSRRTPRKPIRQFDNVDSGGSFGGDSYDSYEDAGSVYSARTLESIEDFEDFAGMDFQTPGMVDFDAEVLDLMQRANPETTAHLDRRVNRRRDQITYDQNMPMMTRQALLTRQASTQVQKQVVDGNNIDRKRLLLRADSMSSVASHDELTLSNHRTLRGAPGRRAPPRSRSSGLGAMVPGGGAPRPSDAENRRCLFRNRSSTGTNSFMQYPNKPNRVQSMTRRGPGDQIEPHSMRGAPPSSDAMFLRRSLHRAKSTTSLRRASDHRVITPQKADRRSEDVSDGSGTDSEDSDVVSDSEDLTTSPIMSSKRIRAHKPPPRAKSDVLPRKKPVRAKSTDKKDMTNKRNRRKLHLMMYESKMGVEMKDLFQKVRNGVAPRSPIKTLMMPSP